jgi:hypothetical protein
MTLPALDNLVRIRQLKVEPRNALEIERMLRMTGKSFESIRRNPFKKKFSRV